MYCDFCDGGGKRYSRRQGGSINEPPYSENCSHCGGSGYAPNNHWASLDEGWIKHQEESSSHLGDNDYGDT